MSYIFEQYRRTFLGWALVVVAAMMLLAGDAQAQSFALSGIPNDGIDGTFDIINNAHDILAKFYLAEGDDDQDGLLDVWEVMFGLDPTDPDGDNGGAGDPDGDGLTNYQEFLLQMTNSVTPCQYANPVNADTDGDGMDDYYEYFSIDTDEQRDLGADEHSIENISAVLDDGSLHEVNSPSGNRDLDSYWRTSDGYNSTNDVLPNIAEWRGPDGIAPGSYESVAVGAILGMLVKTRYQLMLHILLNSAVNCRSGAKLES